MLFGSNPSLGIQASNFVHSLDFEVFVYDLTLGTDNSFVADFLAAMQVCSDWSLLTESLVIIFARFLTKSLCMPIIYEKS